MERVGLEVADPVAEVRLVLHQALRGASRGAGARREEARGEWPGGAISGWGRVQVEEGVRALGCGGGGGGGAAEEGEKVVVSPHSGRRRCVRV